MERKLASVVIVEDIIPIEGADVIEQVKIKGWSVVAKKGEFKIGEKAIYVEVDSFLPIKEEYEFLRKSSYKKMGDLEGFRLKTIKLRGVLSQGLLLPIADSNAVKESLEIGQDVSESLGIVKYEPPIPAELSGLMKGNFPAFLQKTDEERIQNLVDVYENFKKSKFYVTEKLDGSSATYYVNNGVFGVCSRNIELLENEGNSFWKYAREIDLEWKLRDLDRNICLQGELIGEGIQGNPYKLKGQTVKFFNVFDIDEQKRLSTAEFRQLIQYLDLETVPFVMLEYSLPETAQELLEYAEGKSILNNNTEREGLVFRNESQTISFKAISNKFLLKHE